MSQENVEWLHRAYDAFNRRDLVAFLALCDPDVEFISYWMEVEGGGSYRGHGGVRRWWESLFAVYPDFTGEIEAVRELGDLTLARSCIRGHGAGSDKPMDRTLWQVARIRKGKGIWWRFFSSEADALEAPGLRE